MKAAALREAREEAGVEGKVVGAAGKMSFEFGDNTYRVYYFVVQTADVGKEREGRRLRWLKYKQALRRLTYDETRDPLREAWPRIKVSATTRSRVAARRSDPSRCDRVPIVPVLLPFGGIEHGIGKRLDGLDDMMAPQAIMPDDRLIDWIGAQFAKCPCEG